MNRSAGVYLFLTLALLISFGAIAYSGTYETVVFTDAEEAAVIDMANKATSSQITTEIGQTTTVANNVIAARPITGMAQLAAVSYVGPVALEKFRVYVPKWTGAPAPTPTPTPTPTATGGTYDGIVFTATEEAQALTIANTATSDQLKAGGVAATPSSIITGKRPWATLKALSDYSGIAGATMTALRTMAQKVIGSTPAPTPTPTATGGTYDGIVFTADQEAKAFDICNNAGYSQMRTISGTARNIIYDKRPWASISAVAATTNIGATAMQALKNMTSAWIVGVSGKIDTIRMLKTAPPPLNTGVRIPKCRIVSIVPGSNYMILADSNDPDASNPSYQIRAYVPAGYEPILETDPAYLWFSSRSEIAIKGTYAEFPTGSGMKSIKLENFYTTKVTLP